MWAMGQDIRTLPIEGSIEGNYGKMSFSDERDDFHGIAPGEAIIYERMQHSTKYGQWLGIKNDTFSYVGKIVAIKFKIKFIDKKPTNLGRFGFRVYSSIHKGWFSGCDINTWCDVEFPLNTVATGSWPFIIMFFDSAYDVQTIHFAHVSITTMEPVESE